MGIWNFQSVLNKGELDPLAVGRIDLVDYYNGVETARGVLAMPQGGMKKRPGQEHIDTIVSGALSSEGRMENFSFSVDLSYLLVFIDLKMYIYKDGVRQVNINGSGLDYLATPWTIAQVKEMDYIQSADTGVVTHEDIYPKSIIRTSDTAWAISNLPITNTPQYDFNDASSPTPVDEVQTVTFTNYSDGDTFKISLEGILTDEIVFSSTLAGRDATAVAMQEELLALPNTANSGVFVVAGAAGFFQITFTGSSANDWDEVTVTPVKSINVAFQATIATTADGTSRGEDVWSATRGWPRTCTFHEGRLWFGGSKSLPQTIWGSVVNDFFNFKTRKGLDDESISATLDTDQINTIQGIYSNRSLQVFTSGAEFYVKNSPITPENISVAPQTKYGSRRVRPVSIDGVTLFAQRTGKALLQFVFLDEFQANQTTSVSVLAPHLIKTPVKLAVSQGTSSSDANYVYILNQDGSLTVFNTLSAQNVAGFTNWGANYISSIAVVDNKLYMLALRVNAAGTVFSLDVEVENNALNTDSSVLTTSGTPFTTVTGLTHLEGHTVMVKADGYVEGYKVVSGGQITLDNPANVAEVGFMFFPNIKLLPLNVNLQNGPNASSKKKIMRASVQVYESNGVIINDQRIADKTIGVNQFDAPVPYTGHRRIFLSGWSTEAQIEIKQDTPMQFTILNVGMEVKV
jgi:hypothetical protein